MKRRINLMGALGERFGEFHDFDIKTPAEAVRAFMANYPEFKQHLLDSDAKGVGYKVIVGRHELEKEELNHPVGKNEITFVPVVSGGGAAVRIIAGVVLVAAGIVCLYIPGAQGAAPYLIAAGVGLIVGGVVQLLTPIPKIGAPEERPENKPSYLFSGAINTTAQGQPVQLLYGRIITGSAVISAGISVEEIPVDS